MAALTLPSQITVDQARDCLAQLTPQIAAASGPVVTVDASALNAFDSSALSVLLGCRRAATAAGKQLLVQSLPQGLRSMAALYGVDQLLISAGV
jgi:phospholipid transport system transporter-binding protein